jgi:hypothetical protein
MDFISDFIDHNPSQGKRLLGIDYQQFNQLVEKAQLLDEQQQQDIESTTRRLIAKGSGRKPKLSLRNQILLTLVYLRQYPTFQMLGLQFGVSESTANDIFHYWLPILHELLPFSLSEQVKKTKRSAPSFKNCLSN